MEKCITVSPKMGWFRTLVVLELEIFSELFRLVLPKEMVPTFVIRVTSPWAATKLIYFHFPASWKCRLFPCSVLCESCQFSFCFFVRRWQEVMRRMELWVEILELNDNGEYVPVEVIDRPDVRTGGIFLLRQVGWSLLLNQIERSSRSLSTPGMCWLHRLFFFFFF